MTQVPGLRSRRKAAGDAEADQAAAARRHGARERCCEILSRRRRRPPEHQGPPRCEPRRPSPPPRSFGRPSPRALHTERHHPTVSALQIAIARHRPERKESPDIRDSANRTRGESLSRCTAARPKGRQCLDFRQDTQSRVQPPHAPPRRPPSDQARPMPSARPCSAPSRSRDSRACSSRRPRPSRRPRFWIETSHCTALRNIGALMIDARRIERAQHRPGAVDVVHAPAAVPASVR